jgi:hypothetical protein
MHKVDFASARKDAEREGYIGGDYLKLTEGPNRMRLLSECIPHPGEYNGRRTFKWLCYVIDRSDGEVKPFFMAHTIYKAIEAFQMSEDYSFDGVPMPYDITVNAENAGTKEAKYSVVPARNNSEVTPQELTKFAQKKPLEELRAAIRGKSGGEPEKPFDPDEIPV